MTSKSPAGLGPRGRRFWRDITDLYHLFPAELGILERACHVIDRLAAMDAELAGSELVIEGSTGQPRANPLLSSMDSAERTLDVLIRALALPMPDEREGRRRSPSAAMAARMRWQADRPGA